MKAIVKPDRRPGIQVRDVPEPEAGQAPVIRIQAAACEFAAPGGVVVAGAIYSKPVQLNMTRLVRREISLKTARSRTYQTWRRAIALVERGEINLTRIITHKFSVEEAQTAFQITSEKKSIKTILYF